MDKYESLSDVQLPVKRYFHSQSRFAVIILYPKKFWRRLDGEHVGHKSHGTAEMVQR